MHGSFRRIWVWVALGADAIRLWPQTTNPAKRGLALLAEKAGFEPAEGFTPRTLSRRVT